MADLDAYQEELRRWGERTNLVGSTEPSALRLLIDESLAAASHLPRDARVVDLGSGAGLPGVPIAIARRDLRMTLVEIRERRVNFLRHVARTLGLSLDIRRTRIEDPPDDPFDIALIRAVAPPLQAIPSARPWVTSAGEIWIWTTESPSSLPWPACAQIPLPRGSILRIPASAVPHGTS